MAIVDYSNNVITVKQLVSAMEDFLLNKEWEKASVAVVKAIVELRLMKSNIELLKENDGIPYQT
jgi:negative regulator of replication initiation